MQLPDLKKWIREHYKLVVNWILVSIILAMLLSTFFSHIFSKFIPYFDNTPPNIINIDPSINSVVYHLENISINLTDKGMGVDWKKTKITILGRNEGYINGTTKNTKNTLYFIPKSKLKPDIYSISISPVDEAGNFLETPFSSVFYLSQEPAFNFWIRLSEHEYFPEDHVGELTWTTDNKYYLFLIENNGFQSLQNFHISLNFPYPVVGFRTSNLQDAQSCKLKFPEGREVISEGDPIRFPSCDLILECVNLPKGGAYSGQIFVNVNYEGYSWMCNNRTDYSGSYFWEEFGYAKKEKISGTLE